MGYRESKSSNSILRQQSHKRICISWQACTKLGIRLGSNHLVAERKTNRKYRCLSQRVSWLFIWGASLILYCLNLFLIYFDTYNNFLFIECNRWFGQEHKSLFTFYILFGCVFWFIWIWSMKYKVNTFWDFFFLAKTWEIMERLSWKQKKDANEHILCMPSTDDKQHFL